jgi:hypothetical protein
VWIEDVDQEELKLMSLGFQLRADNTLRAIHTVLFLAGQASYVASVVATSLNCAMSLPIQNFLIEGKIEGMANNELAEKR